MSESHAEAPDAQTQFDLLDRIVGRLGSGVMTKTLAAAERLREEGQSGPTITQPLESKEGPAFALAFAGGEVSFVYGGEGGKLPVDALAALIAQRAAPVEQQ
jgi:hypothetical protein